MFGLCWGGITFGENFLNMKTFSLDQKEWAPLISHFEKFHVKGRDIGPQIVWNIILYWLGYPKMGRESVA